MTATPVVEVQYSRFSCPHPAGPDFNQPGQGNIRHRSWTGVTGPIERWRCTTCGQEFSERAGSLMSHSTLPEATVARLLTCQRWGVCDVGTAEIGDVDIKTVPRFQRVAAQRAREHHQQVVQQVVVAGVQLDEAMRHRLLSLGVGVIAGLGSYACPSSPNLACWRQAHFANTKAATPSLLDGKTTQQGSGCTAACRTAESRCCRRV